MNRMLTTGLALLLSLSGAGIAEAQTTLDPSARTDLQLSAGYAVRAGDRSAAVVREVRTVTLPAGRHTLSWSGLSDHAAVETLTVAVAGSPSVARILGHRVQESAYTVAGVSSLLRGASADFQLSHPRRGAHGRARGTIVSLPDGTMMRMGDQVTTIGPSVIQTAQLPARSLSIDVEVPAGPPSKVGIEVTAFVEQVTQHLPRYTLRLEGGATRGSLRGSVVIANLSGTSLDGARATLARHPLRNHADFGIGKAWAAGPLVAHPDPFPLAAPLRFDPTLVAESTLVQADALTVTPTMAWAPRVKNLFEREADTIEQRLERVLDVDVSPPNISMPLPEGEAVVWASPRPGELAEIVGKGHLASGPAVATITMPEPVLRIQVKQRSAQRIGNCKGNALYVITIPEKVFDASGFDLILQGRKAALSAQVRGKSPAKVIAEPLRTIVRLPKRSSDAPRPRADSPGQKLEVEIKQLDCL